MEWYYWAIIIIVILILGVIAKRFIFKKEEDLYSESFLGRTRSNVSNGCKKLLEIIRGC